MLETLSAGATPEPPATPGPGPVASPGPAWARAMRRATDWLVRDCGGGPRPWKFAWVIDLQKGGTVVFLGLVMAWYAGRTPAATSTAAWLYLALHGGYGLVWLVKDLCFPDAAWQVRITVLGGLNAFLGVLGWYWAFGWLLISGRAGGPYPLPDGPWFALCTALVLLGCVLMIGADAQKYYTLRLRRGLITDGLHRYVRHPNYTGEMMIYGGLALLVWHWLPLAVLAWVWGGLFTVNMVLKEASMSRYPEWAAYRRRSWWLVPGLL